MGHGLIIYLSSLALISDISLMLFQPHPSVKAKGKNVAWSSTKEPVFGCFSALPVQMHEKVLARMLESEQCYLQLRCEVV